MEPHVGDSFQFRVQGTMLNASTVRISEIKDGKIHLICHYPTWLELVIPEGAIDQCIDYGQYWPIKQSNFNPIITPTNYKKVAPAPEKEQPPEEDDPYQDVRNW